MNELIGIISDRMAGFWDASKVENNDTLPSDREGSFVSVMFCDDETAEEVREHFTDAGYDVEIRDSQIFIAPQFQYDEKAER